MIKKTIPQGSCATSAPTRVWQGRTPRAHGSHGMCGLLGRGLVGRLTENTCTTLNIEFSVSNHYRTLHKNRSHYSAWKSIFWKYIYIPQTYISFSRQQQLQLQLQAATAQAVKKHRFLQVRFKTDTTVLRHCALPWGSKGRNLPCHYARPPTRSLSRVFRKFFSGRQISPHAPLILNGEIPTHFERGNPQSF